MLEPIIAYLKSVNILEFIGTIAGILGVWFSIKEKILTWPTFILCYLVYVYIAFKAGLYANMALNVIFIFISIYGWWYWSQKSFSDCPHKKNEPPNSKSNIQATGFKIWLINISMWILGTIIIGALLDNYTQSFQPYFDSFATCAAFSAQWMLSKKYIGTWFCWLISDIIFINLWLLQGYWISSFLFLTFIILAIYGWINWHRTLEESL